MSYEADFKCRIIRKLKQTCNALLVFPKYAKEFGFLPALTMLRRNMSLISAETYIESVSGYVQEELGPVTSDFIRGVYPRYRKKVSFSRTPVWVCWFQGEEYLPDICRLCIEQLKKTVPSNAEVVFLNNDNYKHYIELPDYIIAKYESGIIEPANFSDVLRYGLLSTYGGVWIDAAILLTGNVLQEAIDSQIFSVRFYVGDEELRDASRGKWIGGFWAGREGKLTFSYCYESLLHLWKNHNLAIEYLACDYIIWTGFCQVKEIRQEIESIPVNNINIRTLNEKLNFAFSPELMEAILRKNDVHLINRHKEYSVYTEDGHMTIYGYLLRNGL